MEAFDFAASSDFQAYLRRIDVGAMKDEDLKRIQKKWYTNTFGAGASGPRPSAPPPSPPQARSAGGGSARAEPASSSGRPDVVAMLQGGSIVLALLHVLAFFIGGLSFALKGAFLLQVALWGLMLYRQMAPHFALSGEFAARCFQTDAAHYAVYSLLFWAVSDSIFPLIPLLIYSFFNCIGSLSSLRPLLQRLSVVTFPFRERALSVAVQLEVFLLPLLVVMAFTGGSWIAILGHYQFLKFRYMFSAHTRAVVDTVMTAVDGGISQVPVVARYYFLVRNWIAPPLPQR